MSKQGDTSGFLPYLFFLVLGNINSVATGAKVYFAAFLKNQEEIDIHCNLGDLTMTQRCCSKASKDVLLREYQLKINVLLENRASLYKMLLLNDNYLRINTGNHMISSAIWNK